MIYNRGNNNLFIPSFINIWYFILEYKAKVLEYTVPSKQEIYNLGYTNSIEKNTWATWK